MGWGRRTVFSIVICNWKVLPQYTGNTKLQKPPIKKKIIMNIIISRFCLFRCALIEEAKKKSVRYVNITKTGTEIVIYKMFHIWVLIIHYSTASEFLIKVEYIQTHLVNL